MPQEKFGHTAFASPCRRAASPSGRSQDEREEKIGAYFQRQASSHVKAVMTSVFVPRTRTTRGRSFVRAATNWK